MKKFFNIVLIFVLFILQLSSAAAKINMFPQPRYIPPLNFYGDSGKAYKLTDFKSDLLMAVIWSKNCGPCLEDMKYLNSFAKKTAKQGIKVILISPEKEWQTIDQRRSFLRKIGAPNLVSYLDRKGAFRDGMGIMVTPTVILVNKAGEEAGQITGAVRWDDEEVIEYMVKLKEDMLQELYQRKSAN